MNTENTFRIIVLSIFPDIFESFLKASLIGKAVEAGKLSVELINFRDFSDPPHHKVDDEPYGGGAGMVLKPEPLSRAIKHAKQTLPDAKVILFSASGAKFTQPVACSLSLRTGGLILVCGRYEGVDQRFIDLYVDQEFSMGDFVCMGGEVPAMLLIEAIIRLKPEIIGNPESLTNESFTEQLLEAPQYTRPREFEELTVPADLLSGAHKRIEAWRKQESINKTKKNRPDLYEE